MKKSITSVLLLASIMLAAVPAYAVKGKTVKNASAKEMEKFLEDYMGCEEVGKIALEKERSELTCEQRSNLHFCSLYKPLPKDVKQSIGLEVYCNFLVEDKSENAPQGEELVKAAEKAGCLSGSEMRAKLYKKYKEGSEEADALQNFTTAYLKDEEQCGASAEQAKAEQERQ